jgi:hypothetical protein
MLASFFTKFKGLYINCPSGFPSASHKQTQLFRIMMDSIGKTRQEGCILSSYSSNKSIGWTKLGNMMAAVDHLAGFTPPLRDAWPASRAAKAYQSVKVPLPVPPEKYLRHSGNRIRAEGICKRIGEGEA